MVKGKAIVNYYLTHKKLIMREINIAIPLYKRFVVEKIGSQKANIILVETLNHFETLLPQIPYIGGNENRLTENLYLTAVMLAFHRALKKQGMSVEYVGRIIYLGTSSMYLSFPYKAILWWDGRNTFHHTRLEKLKHDAATSQLWQFSDDWVYEYVPGDGKNFLFGVDYTECGNVKYLNEQRAPELTPYLCWLDYPKCAAIQVGLVRNETLAEIDKKCDFRFCN